MFKRAFTLVELLVVIAIIGLIASLSVIALSNARQKSRDSKRVSDIKQVQTALELFFSDQGRYPTVTEWATGSLYATGTMGTSTYMDRIPVDPSDGLAYKYIPTGNGSNYEILYRLEKDTGSLDIGLQRASASSQVSIGPSDGLINYWNFNEGSGNTFYNHSFVGTSSGTFYTGIFSADNRGEANMAVSSTNTAQYISYMSGQPVPDTSGKATISFWFKWVYLINSQPVNFSSFRFYLRGDWANRSMYFLRATNETTYPCGSGWGGWAGPGSVTQFQDNIWYHVAGVRDGNSMKIYVNGVLDNSGNCLQGLTTVNTSGGFWVGQTHSGSVDDIRVYNRALSDLEIKAIYDATK